MSDTPETDAKQHFMYMDAVECVEIDFARKLERERHEARNIARWLYQHGMATLNEGAHRVDWIKEEIK